MIHLFNLPVISIAYIRTVLKCSAQEQQSHQQNLGGKRYVALIILRAATGRNRQFYKGLSPTHSAPILLLLGNSAIFCNGCVAGSCMISDDIATTVCSNTCATAPFLWD